MKALSGYHQAIIANDVRIGDSRTPFNNSRKIEKMAEQNIPAPGCEKVIPM